MANKITKRDNFNAIIEVLNSADRPDLASVMIHEIELLDRKNANRSDKPTPTQIENAEIKNQILSVMTPGRWYKCSEIKELIPILVKGNGTQRTAALMNQLHAENKVEKKMEKRVVYFALI